MMLHDERCEKRVAPGDADATFLFSTFAKMSIKTIEGF